MDFNQRTDYLAPREVALGWWNAISADWFAIHGVTEEGKPGKPEQGIREASGLWAIVTPTCSQLAAVVTQPLPDGSGQWAVALLWYDREKYSRLLRILKASKLSRSKAVVAQIGESLSRQGAREFANSNQPAKRA